MSKIGINLLSSIILIVFVGCSNSYQITYQIGKKFDASKTSNIEIGVTNQQNILEYFGEPLRKGLSNGDEVFIYQREDITFENDSVTVKGNALIIEFDKNGIVKNYYLNYPGKETMLLGYSFHTVNKIKTSPPPPPTYIYYGQY